MLKRAATSRPPTPPPFQYPGFPCIANPWFVAPPRRLILSFSPPLHSYPQPGDSAAPHPPLRPTDELRTITVGYGYPPSGATCCAHTRPRYGSFHAYSGRTKKMKDERRALRLRPPRSSTPDSRPPRLPDSGLKDRRPTRPPNRKIPSFSLAFSGFVLIVNVPIGRVLAAPLDGRT